MRYLIVCMMLAACLVCSEAQAGPMSTAGRAVVGGARRAVSIPATVVKRVRGCRGGR